MPNLASLLKNEIARVARREVRAQTEALKKAASVHRAEIATLKRSNQALAQELRRVGKAVAGLAPQAAAAKAAPPALRFSAKGLASQRKRLALSAEDCGLLVGASGQSIYNWEQGKARPQARHLAAIAALRAMGKKSAAAQLAARRTAPSGERRRAGA